MDEREEKWAMARISRCEQGDDDLAAWHRSRGVAHLEFGAASFPKRFSRLSRML